MLRSHLWKLTFILLAAVLCSLAGRPTFGGSELSADTGVPQLIDGTTYSITHSGSINHSVTIRNGGKLIVTAPLVQLSGNVSLDHATLQVDGGNFAIDCKFQHQYRLAATDGSTVSFKNCQLTTPFPTQIDLNNSTLRIESCIFPKSGFTCSSDHSLIMLDDTTKPGEYIIDEGTHVRAHRCRGVLFWLTFGPEQKAEIELPQAPAHITSFTLPAATQLDLKVTDTEFVLWAILTKPGCDLTVRNSNLRAAGIVFGLPKATRVSGLRNKMPLKDSVIAVPDRKMHFINSACDAWNFYPVMDAHLEVDNCLFGELNAFARSDSVIRHSTCDGAGGYIRVTGNTKVRCENCTVNCSVVATDQGHLTLDHCSVNGDMSASDAARITCATSKIAGKRQTFGQGRID
jgi:hypothetical protein